MSMTYPPMRTFGLSVDTNGTIWDYQGAQGFVPVGSYAPVLPPANTVPPTVQVVSGGITVGNTVIANTGTWTGSPTYTRQWFSAGAAIPGATATSYVLQASDLGNMITCVITATNIAGATSQVSNAVGPVVEP